MDEDIYVVEEAPPPPGAGERVRGIVSTVVGAAFCVAIVLGVVYWLADLGEREAESLPVFRAELNPAKIRPADPGGIDTPYRDIRSYEVAIDGGAAEEGEVQLAPPPATPTEEDVAMAELSAADGEPDEGTASADADEAAAEPADPSGEAPAIAPLVPTRPADLVARNAAASQQAVDEAAQLAARAALSTIQIQLGAFTDRAFTESEWRRIAESNPDLLAGRALAIQPTVSGGTKFYRLRVGPFNSRAEATGVCEALKARGQDCLVATNG